MITLRWGGALALVLGLALGLGSTSCASSVKPVLDPESQEFFHSARLIMTGPEQDIFEHLPDAESRKEFIADFWARRNPDSTAEVNEFKQEFEGRVDYANKHFNEGRKGMDTDRGRIYIYLGPPDRVENFPFNQQESVRSQPGDIRGPVLWWVYYRWELGIAFADYKNNGAFKISEIEGNLMEAIDMAKLGVTAPGTGGRPLGLSLTYDRTRRVLTVTIPIRSLDFKEESGRLTTKFTFDLYIYRPGQTKDHLTEVRDFSSTPSEVQALPALVFEFPYALPAGKSYVDVIVSREGSLVKARKIFPIKS